MIRILLVAAAFLVAGCSVQIAPPTPFDDRIARRLEIYDSLNRMQEAACIYTLNAAGGVDCR